MTASTVISTINKGPVEVTLAFAEPHSAGTPICGLSVKCSVGGASIIIKTDGKGLARLPPVPPNQPIEVEVEKMTGGYKKIGTINSGKTSRTIQVISPKIKVEVETKKHEGSPGAATRIRPVNRQGAATPNVTSARSANGAPVALVSGPVLEKSGVQWVSRFMQSTSISSLKSPFKEKVTRFIAALNAAGVSVQINTTLRPPQRSYLMYYAREVSSGRLSPASVPSFVPQNGDAPVHIDWAHRGKDGKPDNQAAISAAKAMDAAYGAAGIIGKPYSSNHNGGMAIDMKLNPSWGIGKEVINANGKKVMVKSKRDIIDVGATYGVKHWNYAGAKNKIDDPHWSATGN